MKTEKKSTSKKNVRTTEPKNVKEQRENLETGATQQNPRNTDKKSNNSRGSYEGTKGSDS